MKFSLKQKNKGFTLIETLVAISIFTVSVIALLTIVSSGITDTLYAKKKMAAIYLAQEGIEYMRNMRDTYLLYPPNGTVGWDDFKVKIEDCNTDNGKGCYFNDQALDFNDQIQPIIDITISPCVAGVCPTLLYDSLTGKYNYTTGVNSGFVRRINITNINAHETQIYSTVTFMNGSVPYEITFSENLFNWIRQ
ncbi:MAG: type II secretion system protein [Patescibacteria group bacterium]